MNFDSRVAWRIWLPVSLLVLSLAAHVAVLQIAGVTSTPSEVLSASEAVEVVLIEEVPLPPEPPSLPTPEPTPQPTPEPTPPPAVEEILSSENQTVEATPEPTPEPVATPAPTPRPTPKATPRPDTKPSIAKPSSAPTQPAAPRGKMVEARPDYASNPPPRYPDLARRNGWEGEVIVRAQVSTSGKVTSASVFRKSSYAILDQAAVAAVRKWKFTPRTVGGQAVDATVEVPVNFSLRR